MNITSLPAPADALRAWSDLPEETRTRVVALARQGTAYPDRDVAWLAVAWARAVRSPPGPGPLRPSVLAVVGKSVVALLVVALAVAHHLTPDRVPWAVVMGGSLLALFAVTFEGRSSDRTWAAQVEMANLAYAVHVGRLRGPDRPVRAYRAVITRDPRDLALAIGLPGVVIFLISSLFDPWPTALRFTSFMVAFMAVTLWYERWWEPRDGTAVVLTDAGPTFPYLRTILTWDDIRSVDFGVDKRTNGGYIRWQLRHDEYTVAAHCTLPAWRRRLLTRRVRSKGGALVTPFEWLIDPPERLVTASRSHLAARVRPSGFELP